MSSITGTLLHLTNDNINSKCWKCSHSGVCAHKEKMLELVNKINEMKIIDDKESIFGVEINCQHFMEYPKSNPWGVIPCSYPTDGYTPSNPWYNNKPVTLGGTGDYISLSGSTISSGNLDNISVRNTSDVKCSEPITKSQWTGNDNIQFYQ